MGFAKRIRKENIAIRLLEAPLTRADTAREAADAISQSFLSLTAEPAHKNKVETPSPIEAGS